VANLKEKTSSSEQVYICTVLFTQFTVNIVECLSVCWSWSRLIRL